MNALCWSLCVVLVCAAAAVGIGALRVPSFPDAGAAPVSRQTRTEPPAARTPPTSDVLRGLDLQRALFDPPPAPDEAPAPAPPAPPPRVDATLLATILEARRPQALIAPASGGVRLIGVGDVVSDAVVLDIRRGEVLLQSGSTPLSLTLRRTTSPAPEGAPGPERPGVQSKPPTPGPPSDRRTRP